MLTLLPPAPPLADAAHVVKEEQDVVVVPAAAAMQVDFASPGGGGASDASKQVAPARKRRLTEAQRLQPFVWEHAGGEVGPALLAQFAGAEVRCAARSAT
jgi:hypothetical protein